MSVLDEVKLDFRRVALSLVTLLGTDPEYLDVVEAVDDELTNIGYDLTTFSEDELEEIYNHIIVLCHKAVVTIP